MFVLSKTFQTSPVLLANISLALKPRTNTLAYYSPWSLKKKKARVFVLSKTFQASPVLLANIRFFLEPKTNILAYHPLWSLKEKKARMFVLSKTFPTNSVLPANITIALKPRTNPLAYFELPSVKMNNKLECSSSPRFMHFLLILDLTLTKTKHSSLFFATISEEKEEVL